MRFPTSLHPTIVWWFVELPDGTRGWTPANTSEFRVLAPMVEGQEQTQ